MEISTRLSRLFPTLLVAAGLLPGCADLFASAESVCTPGESVSCACPDGTTSAQVCAADGAGFDACQCGAQSEDPTEYIVGGEQSREFAATGALLVGHDGLCTATLVAPQAVLTAAHCVSNSAASELRFRLGVNKQAPIVDRGVRAIAVHPDYVPFDKNQPWTFQNGRDLAILELDAPVEEVAPAQLHLGDATSLLDSPARLIGYGASDVAVVIGEPQPLGSGVRRSTTVRFDTLTAQALRYAFGGTGACSGDSGGPAFIEIDGSWRQVGVTSWGDVTCQRYGFYQRLDLHADWIRRTAGLPAERAVVCEADDRCDGQCQLDDDCVEMLCPNGSCPASGGACAADGVCEASCGSVDSDCADGDQQGVDPCVAYGLHGNGRCDPQCPRDPECSTDVGSNTCNPVTVRVSGTQCLYLDAGGQICQQVPLTGLSYDPSRRSCVAIDATGTACGFAPATFQYNQFNNICTYYDPAGNPCGQAYPYCTPGGCSC